jgi:hypothetical protein
MYYRYQLLQRFLMHNHTGSIVAQPEVRDSQNPVRTDGGSILVVSLFQIISNHLHDNKRQNANNRSGNVLCRWLVWDELFGNVQAYAANDDKAHTASE